MIQACTALAVISAVKIFWTLAPKKGPLSCQLTFLRSLLTMAKPFYLWATNCTNHKTISIASKEQQSIFNIGDAPDVDTRAARVLSTFLNSYSIPDKIKEWRDRIGQVDAIYI